MRIIALLLLLSSPLAAQTYSFQVDAQPVLVDPSAPVANIDVSMVCDVPGVPPGGAQLCFEFDPSQINMFGIQPLACDPQTGCAFFAPYWTNVVDTTTPGGPYDAGIGYVAILPEFNPASFPTFDTLTPLVRFQVYSGPSAVPSVTSLSFVGNNALNLPGAFDTVLEVSYTDDTGQVASYTPPDFPVFLNLVADPVFRQGDANESGTLNLTDCLVILEYGLIAGTPPPACEAVMDANGNGTLDTLPDCLYLLGYLFNGGPPPPAGLGCNSTSPQGLTCDAPACL